MLNFVIDRANQLWEILAFDLKNSSSLKLFNNGLKSWRCTECKCQISSRFLADVGYI